MHIAVLAASGRTGLQLLSAALKRGHTVTALARDPGRIALPPSRGLRLATADVRDPTSWVRTLHDVDALVSGLGNVKTGGPGTLTAGAQVVIGAEVSRIVWLGAFGTGRSAASAGPFSRRLIGLMLRSELPDKAAAENAVLAHGGTVFHAGPLTNGHLGPDHTAVDLRGAPTYRFAPPISRASVAAHMLDEAERADHAGHVVVLQRT